MHKSGRTNGRSVDTSLVGSERGVTRSSEIISDVAFTPAEEVRVRSRRPLR